jgi:hypothetical protein
MSSMKPDIEVRLILRGQVATFEVEGGFARRPAPCDGLLVETTRSTILVPMEDVVAAVDEWRGDGTTPSRRGAAPRAGEVVCLPVAVQSR